MGEWTDDIGVKRGGDGDDAYIDDCVELRYAIGGNTERERGLLVCPGRIPGPRIGVGDIRAGGVGNETSGEANFRL